MSQRSSRGHSTDAPKSAEEATRSTTSDEDLRLATISDGSSPASSSIPESTRNVEPKADATNVTSLDKSQESLTSTEDNKATGQARETGEVQQAGEQASESRRIGLQTTFTERVQNWNVTAQPENSNQEVMALSPRRSSIGDLTRYHRDLAHNYSGTGAHESVEMGPLPQEETSSTSVRPTSSALPASSTSTEPAFAPLLRFTEEPSAETFQLEESEARYRTRPALFRNAPVFPSSASFNLLMELNQSDERSRYHQIAEEPEQAAQSSSGHTVNLSLSALNVQGSTSSDSLEQTQDPKSLEVAVDTDSKYKEELMSSDLSTSQHTSLVTPSTEFSVEQSISTQESGSGPWLAREPVGFDHSLEEQANEEGIPIVSDSGTTTDDETSYEWDEPDRERPAVEPRRVVDPERQAMIERRWEDMDTAQSRSPVTAVEPEVPEIPADSEDPAYDASAEDHSLTKAPPAKRRRASQASQASSSLKTTESTATSSSSGFELVTSSESKSSSSLDRVRTHTTEEQSTENSEGGIPIVSDDYVSDEEYSFDPEEVLDNNRRGSAVEQSRVVDVERQAMIEQRWEDMDTAEDRSPVASAPATEKSESGVSAKDQSNTKSTDSSSSCQSSQKSTSAEKTTSTSRSASPVPTTAQEAPEEPHSSAEEPIKAPAAQAPAAKRRPKRK
ncbi:hypothetical protein CAEBREN_00517 [Caenorhabditis brenneri]|uniref:Uncharacterized protein n=1 Tax=Caenorhabditis brenneri TaxID=135651 RepID=G0MQS6_CAEBE|nr:hypothetical protein CAEBREN_00517 [Caenorhabditis brenneri]